MDLQLAHAVGYLQADFALALPSHASYHKPPRRIDSWFFKSSVD